MRGNRIRTRKGGSRSQPHTRRINRRIRRATRESFLHTLHRRLYQGRFSAQATLSSSDRLYTVQGSNASSLEAGWAGDHNGEFMPIFDSDKPVPKTRQSDRRSERLLDRTSQAVFALTPG